MWETLYGDNGNQSARVGAFGPSGLLIAGGSGPALGDSDVALWLLDPETGEVQWEHTWGGPEYEFAHGLAVFGARLYITGETASFGAGGDDAFLISGDAVTGGLPPEP